MSKQLSKSEVAAVLANIISKLDTQDQLDVLTQLEHNRSEIMKVDVDRVIDATKAKAAQAPEIPSLKKSIGGIISAIKRHPLISAAAFLTVSSMVNKNKQKKKNEEIIVEGPFSFIRDVATKVGDSISIESELLSQPASKTIGTAYRRFKGDGRVVSPEEIKILWDQKKPTTLSSMIEFLRDLDFTGDEIKQIMKSANVKMTFRSDRVVKVADVARQADLVPFVVKMLRDEFNVKPQFAESLYVVEQDDKTLSPEQVKKVILNILSNGSSDDDISEELEVIEGYLNLRKLDESASSNIIRQTVIEFVNSNRIISINDYSLLSFALLESTMSWNDIGFEIYSISDGLVEIVDLGESKNRIFIENLLNLAKVI